MQQLNLARVQFRMAVAVLRRWRQQFCSTIELRIYSTHLLERNDLAVKAPTISKDSWSNLEAFDSHNGWVSRDVFLKEAKTRLANGEHVYTIAENGRLVHYGWAAAPVAHRYIPDAGQFAEFPGDSVYLYDFFTHPECRNRGIFQNSLKQILREWGATLRFEEAFIGVDSANGPSRRAIEKIGFSYRFSLFQQWRWFRVKRWSTTKPSRGENVSLHLRGVRRPDNPQEVPREQRRIGDIAIVEPVDVDSSSRVTYIK